MLEADPKENAAGAPVGIEKYRRVIFGELVDRTVWFIRLRWFAAPAIMLAVIVLGQCGFNLSFLPFFLIALFILAYNGLVYGVAQRNRRALRTERPFILNFNRFQFALDFIALLLLSHYTGGISSPLLFFFTFHIIFASILLSPGSGYGLVTLAVAGMLVVVAAESHGWLAVEPLRFGQKVLSSSQPPLQTTVTVLFWALSLYATVIFGTSIVAAIRRRISKLVDVTEADRRLNSRLNSLYTMTEAIGSVRNLKMVLNMVTSELCQVMGVLGISVKLLSDDRKQLEYVAAHGLVADVFKSKVIEVAKSPLNREIIEGKPFVTGRIKPGEMMFQLGEDLAAANIQSVLFVPLVVEGRVIGILGAYCRHAERFSAEEVHFFRRVAGLVAVAIENARSYEAIEKLMTDRHRFMMRVAHNLRSPLAAMVSMLDVVRGGYKGDLSAGQNEYLDRIDRRARTMIRMINGLLTLARNGETKGADAFRPLDLTAIAGRIRRTFQDEAQQKNLCYEVVVPPDLPPVQGNTDMIEQTLENLVANAIKYTAAGGRVEVAFIKGLQQTVQIRVHDSGIGIAPEDLKHLFTEFFRAENARAMEEIGTGLGLAIVKQTVERHGGRILVESTPGQGSTFTIDLPVAPAKNAT